MRKILILSGLAAIALAGHASAQSAPAQLQLVAVEQGWQVLVMRRLINDDAGCLRTPPPRPDPQGYGPHQDRPVGDPHHQQIGYHK